MSVDLQWFFFLNACWSCADPEGSNFDNVFYLFVFSLRGGRIQIPLLAGH